MHHSTRSPPTSCHLVHGALRMGAARRSPVPTRGRAGGLYTPGMATTRQPLPPGAARSRPAGSPLLVEMGAADLEEALAGDRAARGRPRRA